MLQKSAFNSLIYTVAVFSSSFPPQIMRKISEAHTVLLLCAWRKINLGACRGLIQIQNPWSSLSSNLEVG